MSAPSPPPHPPHPDRGSRLTRVVRTLIPVGILGVILMTLLTVGFVEYSARPGFCKTCHNMRPYYDSWASSSHREVPCISCHYAPGIRAEAMGKLQAANQVVKYLTGSYGMKPWAEIEDAACMRSGCHSERKVEGLVDYDGVSFDHAKHLGELRRGKQLRCTSCHSQIVQGQHVAVTGTTCFLCHFKDRPASAPLAGCTGCHPSPPRVVAAAGYVVEHAQYVADRISCVSCHSEVTAGSGAAERSRCFNCHNEPDRLAKFDDPPLVHRVHITDHKVECTQCHTPIEHRIVALAGTFELDCKSCHTSAHDSQRRLYAGIGGHNVPNAPSKMFLARVSCLGCHAQPANLRVHERVRVAGEASCLSCHGVRYANMLPTWKQEMEQKLDRVAPVVARARMALAAAPAGRRAASDSLLRLAQENLDLVRTGRPAHNVVYADELLRASLSLVREAVRAGRLPYTVPEVNLGPPLSEGACGRCHVGAERATVRFRGGGEFPHERHVVRGGLACIDCHTPLEQHGGTRITTPEACQSCHHRDAPFQAGRSCLTCHDGVLERHSDVVHAGPGSCLACHAGAAVFQRWSRQICTLCHVKQATEHYEEQSRTDQGCQMCHEKPAFREPPG